MKKRIYLNDQGIYVDCIKEEDRISFEFEKSINALNNKVTIKKEGNIITCSLGLKKFIRINNGEIEKINDITTTEIRILCAIANRIDMLDNKNEYTLINMFNKICDELDNLPKEWDETQHFYAELHTHFLEILNAEEFVSFLNKYNITYPMNENGELDFDNGQSLTFKELVDLGYKDNLINSLRITIKGQSSFDLGLVDVNKNRKKLLERLLKVNENEIIKNHKSEEYEPLVKKINFLENYLKNKKYENSNYSKSKKKEIKIKTHKLLEKYKAKKNHIISNILYDDILDESLNKLTREKIEYSEISFSNEHRLKYLSEKYKNDSRFNLLYSIYRNVDVEKFKEKSKILEELLSNGKVIGIDLMGNETPLFGKDRENFKNGLMCMLPVLHIHSNSLLRIHASEFRDTKDNMLETLKIIDECTNELNDTCKRLFNRSFGKLPPPRIRMGHGVNINKSDELAHLLKKYDVVVEINASSNFALNQISSTNDIPLDFYKENNIKYVLSTDGGGVYSTSIHQEENIVRNIDEEKTSGTIKEQMTKGNKVIKTKSQKKQDLFNKIKEYQKDNVKEKEYSSMADALNEENSIKGDKNNIEFVNYEINNLEGYIMDIDPEFDRDYYERMINIINDYNKTSDSDYAKIFLFLLEKELFSERKTSFKTLHYLDSINNKEKVQDNVIDNLNDKLVRLYDIIKKRYEIESENIKKELIEERIKGSNKRI